VTGTGEEPLRLQRCPACGTWNVPPLVRCPVDPAHDLVDTPVQGTGTVFSHIVTHVAMRDSARPHVPYVTTLVELTEGPRLVTHFAGHADRVTIGLPVTVTPVAEPSPHLPDGALVATPLDRPETDHLP
jgi:uncharacterized protein